MFRIAPSSPAVFASPGARAAHTTLVRANGRSDSKDEQAHTPIDRGVQSRIDELFSKDPKTQASLERVREAAATVAALQAQKALFDQETTAANRATAWQAQDQEWQQAQRAAERGADADILQAADDLEKAQAEMISAMRDQSKWASSVDEEAEKVESAKAGAVAATGAVTGSLPFLAASGSLPVVSFGSLGVLLVTGFLFGVTYRYAVRQDMGNRQLRSGVVGAFGLVRGLALAEEIVKSSSPESLILDPQTVAAAAVAAGESMLSIGFAAVALEFAFQKGYVKTFGSISTR